MRACVRACLRACVLPALASVVFSFYDDADAQNHTHILYLRVRAPGEANPREEIRILTVACRQISGQESVLPKSKHLGTPSRCCPHSWCFATCLKKKERED